MNSAQQNSSSFTWNWKQLPILLLLMICAMLALGQQQEDTKMVEEFSPLEAVNSLQHQLMLSLGWSRWSEWSACSAKCGQQGVQLQARRCLNLYCSGPVSRHRVCRADLKDCAYPVAKFKSETAAKDDDSTPTPPLPLIDPLALECAARSTVDPLLPAPGLPQNCSQLLCLSSDAAVVPSSLENSGNSEVEANQVDNADNDDDGLRAFPVSLRDGQQCRLAADPDQQAVCLQGRCLPVGCDQLVGSSARPDQCGVCGGDGRSCAGRLFRWRDSGHFSPCDRSCGPGAVQVSVSVCMNTNNLRVVPERMCADQPRPRPQVRKCAHVVCPTKWMTGEWGDCSANCGLGEQQREVFCAETAVASDDGDGAAAEILTAPVPQAENRRVADQYCWHSQRPIDVRKCDGSGACPEWAVGEWGPCQAVCGRGVRTRPVECRDADGQRFHNWHCLMNVKEGGGGGKGQQKPAQEQPCWTGTSCTDGQNNNNGLLEGISKGSSSGHVLNYMEAPPPASEDGLAKGLLMEEDTAAAGGGQWPRFLAGAWGQCSASCGPGIRSRPVDCMARQAIGGQLLRLPDYECQGQPRPEQFQPCQLAACPPRIGAQSAIRSLTQSFPPPPPTGKGFRWEHGQWTLCSASCLGGRQKSPVLCMDMATGQSVAWTKCQEVGAGPKPDDLVRGCNRHSCPPDWEIGPWSTCSHSCGGGLRTRRVRCARAVSRTGASTLILPDAQCPGKRPSDEEPCGMVDCSPEWSIGSWGQCSASCGRGEQRRSLSCLRRDSLGQLEERQSVDCAQTSGGETPKIVQLCNLGPCPGSVPKNFGQEVAADDQPASPSAQPFSYAEPQSLALLGPAKDQPLADGERQEESENVAVGNDGDDGRQNRRLTLRVGGFANLYEGTSLKVKCPVRGEAAGGKDRRQIQWTKNGRPLQQSPRLKVSANGALRIFRARQKDAGVYACQTLDGRRQLGNVTLRFKPNDGTTGPEDMSEGREGGGGGEENRTGRQAAKQLLQRIRDSLYRMGSHSLYQRLASVRDPSELRIDYALSDWGQCEQPDCGQGEGLQVRLLKCQLHVGHESASLEEALCESFGVQRPHAARPCMADRCPRWLAGEWSECAASRCVRQATALQRREVRCTLGNGTETSPMLCPRKNRPKLKRECQNSNCSAEWRPSVWGKCSKQCGDGGVQMRLLRCVWRGTRKPAGPHCEHGQRPAAIRACASAKPLAECPVEGDEEAEADNSPNWTKDGAGSSRSEQPLVELEEEEEEEDFGKEDDGKKKEKLEQARDGILEQFRGSELENAVPKTKSAVPEQKELLEEEQRPLEEEKFSAPQALALVSDDEGQGQKHTEELQQYPTDRGQRGVDNTVSSSAADIGARLPQLPRLAALRPFCDCPHAAGPSPPHRPSAAALHLCEDQSRFCDILRLFQTCDQPRIRAQCCFSCRRLMGANNKGRREKGEEAAAATARRI